MKKLNVLPIMCLTLFLASGGPSPDRSRSEQRRTEGATSAFSFNGMTTGGGGAFTVFAAVGRFTADGAGNLTKRRNRR